MSHLLRAAAFPEFAKAAAQRDAHCVSWCGLGHELVDFGAGPTVEMAGLLGEPVLMGRSLTIAALVPLAGAVGLCMPLSCSQLERLLAGPAGAVLVPKSRAKWLEDRQ